MRNAFKRNNYPDAVDPLKVGKYPLEVFSGGGYFYDEVLEYRVWVKNTDELICYSFAKYSEAERFAKHTIGAELPLVLIKQYEYIAQPKPKVYKHVKQGRLAEWQVEWLENSKGTASQIPRFLKENM